MARVLAISSHVVRGTVGLAATVPALQWLGHEVWALPTVLLASRPGLGRFVRHEVPAPDLAAHAGGTRGRRLLGLARCGAHRLFPLAAGGGGRRRGDRAHPAGAAAPGPGRSRPGRCRPPLCRRGDRRGHPGPAAAAGLHRHAQPVRARMADRHRSRSRPTTLRGRTADRAANGGRHVRLGD